MAEEEMLYTEPEKKSEGVEEEMVLVDTTMEVPLTTDEVNEPEEELTAADVASAGNIKSDKIRFSIKFKIALSLAILLVASLLSISISLLNNEKQELMNEMRYRAEIIGKNLSGTLREAFEDDMSRHPLVQGTKQQIRDLVEIAVYDTSFNLIDTSDDQRYGTDILMRKAENAPLIQLEGKDREILSILTETKIDEPAGTEHVVIYQPVKFETTVIGYAVLTFTKKFINEKIRGVERQAYILIAISLVIGLTLFMILINTMLNPIKVLVAGVRKIATGNLRYKIRLKTKDELEMLAGEFNTMTDELIKAQKEIVEKGKVEEQVHIAEGLQKNLLPDTFPVSDFYEVAGYYKAARGMGGDYYDVLDLKDRGKLGVTVADVSGKGVPAAVIMVIIRTIFHAVAKFVPTPDKALDVINKNLAGKAAGDKNATMFYYMYDFRTGDLVWSNAGHNPMLIYKKGLDKVTLHPAEDAGSKPNEFGGVEGAPIGVMAESSYTMVRTRLEEGDVVVLYTDGIPEAANTQNQFYTDAALYEAVRRFSPLPGKEILQNMVKELEDFSKDAPQHDDMTIVVMKVKKIDPVLRQKTLAALQAAAAAKTGVPVARPAVARPAVAGVSPRVVTPPGAVQQPRAVQQPGGVQTVKPLT